MDKERKKKIDDLWMNTDYGKYVLLASSEKYDEANKILEKITNEWPFSYDEVEKETGRRIYLYIQKRKYQGRQQMS